MSSDIEAYVDECTDIIESGVDLKEADTRGAFITPLLEVLGWGSTYPNVVREYEIGLYNKYNQPDQADYALQLDGDPVVFIEVKRMGSEVSEAVPQLKGYMHEEGVDIGVATNGTEFWVFVRDLDGDSPEIKQVSSTNLADLAEKENGITALRKSRVQSGECKTLLEQVMQGDDALDRIERDRARIKSRVIEVLESEIGQLSHDTLYADSVEELLSKIQSQIGSVTAPDNAFQSSETESLGDAPVTPESSADTGGNPRDWDDGETTDEEDWVPDDDTTSEKQSNSTSGSNEEFNVTDDEEEPVGDGMNYDWGDGEQPEGSEEPDTDTPITLPNHDINDESNTDDDIPVFGEENSEPVNKSKEDSKNEREDWNNDETTTTPSWDDSNTGFGSTESNSNSCGDTTGELSIPEPNFSEETTTPSTQNHEDEDDIGELSGKESDDTFLEQKSTIRPVESVNDRVSIDEISCDDLRRPHLDLHDVAYEEVCFLRAVVKAMNGELRDHSVPKSMTPIKNHYDVDLEELVQEGYVKTRKGPCNRNYYTVTNEGQDVCDTKQNTLRGVGSFSDGTLHRVGLALTREYLDTHPEIREVGVYQLETEGYGPDSSTPLVGLDESGSRVMVAEVVSGRVTADSDGDGSLRVGVKDYDPIRRKYRKLAAQEGEAIWVVRNHEIAGAVLRALVSGDAIPFDMPKEKLSRIEDRRLKIDHLNDSHLPDEGIGGINRILTYKQIRNRIDPEAF